MQQVTIVVLYFTGIFLLFLNLACATKPASHPSDYPAELHTFVGRNANILTYAKADLNGDQLQDYAVVTEIPYATEQTRKRVLKLLIRNKDHSLRLAKTNHKIIMCSNCGGIWGDPFVGITVQDQLIRIEHHGGSNWRWFKSHDFRYSAPEQSWYLTRVEEHTFTITNPEAVEIRIYTPPKNYGTIDIADFDPEDFLRIHAN